jgi:hypothetical protein
MGGLVSRDGDKAGETETQLQTGAAIDLELSADQFKSGTRVPTAEPECTKAPMHRFAWLEFDGEVWHFLTRLDAHPATSARRWSDKERALMELMDEGWAVVRAYPRYLPPDGSGEEVQGYGLTRHVH